MAYVKGQPFFPQFTDPATGLLMTSGTVEFYLTGTSTPTPYYTDTIGTSGGTSLTLLSSGKPSTDVYFDTAITYKMLVKNAAGTTLETIDPFIAKDTTLGREVINHATLAAATADTTMKAGYAVTLKEPTTGNGGGGIWDVIAGTGTANGYNIVAHDTLSLSFVLRFIDEIDITQAGGVTGVTAVDNALVIETLQSFAPILTLRDGDFEIDTKIDLTRQGITLKGAGANWAFSNTVLQPAAALADYVIETSVSRGGMTFDGFEIDGQDSTNLLGGVYLKNDGSSTNFSNRIENLRIIDIDTNDAAALKVESWGTTIKNFYALGISRGTGIKFGEAGVSGTTQYIQRAYLIQCNVCISVSATTLGVTIESPVFESSPVCYYQRSNEVVMINPYFEDVNSLNIDGVNRTALNLNKVQNNAGTAVDYAVYLDGSDAKLTIYGGRAGGLSSTEDSKFIGVGSGSVLVIHDFRFDSTLDERHIVEIGTGRIEIINPKSLNIEALKDSVSIIKYGDGTDSYWIENGVTSTTGPSLITDLSRKRGDVHTFSSVGTDGIISQIVSYSASDVTTSAMIALDTDVDVADASDYRAGDYVVIRLDDLSFEYTTIASISTNTLTLTDAVSGAVTIGNVIKFWRWGSLDTSKNEQSGTSIATTATAEILAGIPTSTDTVKIVLVTAFQSNTISGIYRLYVENSAGTGVGQITETVYENGGFTSPTFAVGYNSGLVDLDMTNNDAATVTVSAKVLESISIF